MSSGKAFAFVAVMVVTLAAGFVFFADDSDAETYPMQNQCTASGFKEDSKGTLHVVANFDVAMNCAVTVYEDGKQIHSQNFTGVEAGVQTLDVKFELSKGVHSVDVSITPEGGVESKKATIEIDVGENVWSHIITYVAIVVIAIVAIIIAVVYMRAKPNNKPTTTFTELEAEKKASAQAEPTKAAPAKTEKVKYTSSRRK